jgi:hypothetical protein
MGRLMKEEDKETLKSKLIVGAIVIGVSLLIFGTFALFYYNA